jgi:hypothetical protein
MNQFDELAVALVQAMNKAGYGTKAPGTSGTGGMLSPGGIFGSAGLDQDVISARITPRGISSMLPAHADIYCYPEFGFITGIEETTGSEPDVECATCLSGETESCIQTAAFGYVCRETKTMDASKAIERVNSGEVDIRLINDILGQDDFFRPNTQFSGEQAGKVATVWAMLECGVLLQNKLMPMLWSGNPANNIGSGYKEFPGFDMLIGTGKQDAHTQVACSALDSTVLDYNYALTSALLDDGTSFRIVRFLEYMEANLFHNASRMNLAPVKWVIAMRPELFYELTNIWPVVYLTTRGGLALPGSAMINMDAGRIREMIDEMRNGMFIYVNGRKYDVVTDDSIVELNGANAGVNPGEFASNIYFIPMTYLGTREGAFLQYKDYRATSVEYSAAHASQLYWTDAGRFQWTVETKKWCYTLSARIEPRLVLKVPQLAGVIQHVKYSPMLHLRNWDQKSPYFYKGGVSSRDVPSLYSEWDGR